MLGKWGWGQRQNEDSFAAAFLKEKCFPFLSFPFLLSFHSLQKHGRGGRACRRHRRSVVAVQAVARGWIARRACGVRKEARISAAVEVRRHVLGRNARRSFVELRKAAIIVQKHRRGGCERRTLSARRAAAVNVQRQVRGWLAR